MPTVDSKWFHNQYLGQSEALQSNISDSLKHSSQWMNGDEGIVEHRVNDLLVRSADCLVSGND